MKRLPFGITLYLLIACALFGQTAGSAPSKDLAASEPERRLKLISQWSMARPHLVPFSNAVYASVILCGIFPLEAPIFNSKDLKSDSLKRMDQIDEWGSYALFSYARVMHQKSTATTQRKDLEWLQSKIGTKAARDEILALAREMEGMRALFHQNPELMKNPAYSHVYAEVSLYTIKAWIAFVLSDQMQKMTYNNVLFGGLLATYFEQWEYIEGIGRVK